MHSLWVLLPGVAGPIAWVWAAIVGISVAQRIVGGYRTLRAPAASQSSA